MSIFFGVLPCQGAKPPKNYLQIRTRGVGELMPEIFTTFPYLSEISAISVVYTSLALGLLI